MAQITRQPILEYKYTIGGYIEGAMDENWGTLSMSCTGGHRKWTPTHTNNKLSESKQPGEAGARTRMALAHRGHKHQTGGAPKGPPQQFRAHLTPPPVQPRIAGAGLRPVTTLSVARHHFSP